MLASSKWQNLEKKTQQRWRFSSLYTNKFVGAEVKNRALWDTVLFLLLGFHVQ